MIYQWNEQTRAFVKEYGALYEIHRDLGILMEDVILSINDGRPVGGFFFTITPTLDEPTPMKPKNNIKISLMLSEELLDDFVVMVGQRNRQEIIRNLMAEWVKKEKELKKKVS